MTQWRKYHDAFEKVGELKKQRSYLKQGVPDRPNVSIFAEELRENKKKCPYLILDEAHSIKNSKSMTYLAVSDLRELCDMCLMLTGSPIDNKWEDLYALATMLKAQPLNSVGLARKIFVGLDAKDPKAAPKDRYIQRLHTFLSAFMIRQPAVVISLPTLVEFKVEFTLSDKERYQSNTAYLDFEKSLGIANVNSGPPTGPTSAQNMLAAVLMARRKAGRKAGQKVKGKSKKKITSGNQPSPVQWGALFKAQQWAYHPLLFEITDTFRNERSNAKMEVAETFENAEEASKWEDWKAKLSVDDLWRSSRVDAIIQQVNTARDLQRHAKILIFSESVYFLNILDIAFEQMPDPIKAFHYSGRLDTEERTRIANCFNDGPDFAAMLISQGAGGLCVNLKSANIVILCGPFWKDSAGASRCEDWRAGNGNNIYKTSSSESVYFLDILDIAFEQMNEPLKALLYSGRSNPEERAQLAKSFNTDEGTKIMLISRGAGGLGLNLTAASVVILCGPFWKNSAEEQALERAYRFGQQNEVVVLRLFAKRCSVESFRANTRNREQGLKPANSHGTPWTKGRLRHADSSMSQR